MQLRPHWCAWISISVRVMFSAVFLLLGFVTCGFSQTSTGNEKVLAVAIEPSLPGLILASPKGQLATDRKPTWRFRTISLEGLELPQLDALSPGGDLVRLRTAGADVTLDLTKSKGWDIPFETRPIQDRNPQRPLQAVATAARISDTARVALQEQVAELRKDGSFTDKSKSAPLETKGLDWRFFAVEPNPKLYAPMLWLGGTERVLPSTFEIWTALPTQSVDSYHPFFNDYLKKDDTWKREHEAVYFRVTPLESSWRLEYWIYFPFDSGGLSTHFDDSEHFFVEVDALGGRVRRLLGAGHGALAGNNIYDASFGDSAPIDLPVVAYIELGKHATAPEVNGDDRFTPGIDENFFGSRAKVWGLRDASSNDNPLKSFEDTMSITRRITDRHSVKGTEGLFPGADNLGAKNNRYELKPIDRNTIDKKHCEESENAKRVCRGFDSVIKHPDYANPNRIWKEWNYPENSLRYTFSMGPRHDLKSHLLEFGFNPRKWGKWTFGIGRWKQEGTEDSEAPSKDPKSCVLQCQAASGREMSILYQDHLSNIFGFQVGSRAFWTQDPRMKGTIDKWFMVGPFMELPFAVLNELRPAPKGWPRWLWPKHPFPGNINVSMGLIIKTTAAPRWNLRVSTSFFRFGGRTFK